MDAHHRDAFSRADQLTAELTRRYPGLFKRLDQWRQHPPMPWPDWCLIPMAATATYLGEQQRMAFPPPPIAAAHALYLWRYSQSVWTLTPDLTQRLLTQVPDEVSVEQLATLPEWCVHITTDHPEYPGSGLWLHLEHDTNTGRPELRILIDMDGGGLDTLVPIPVYLDRPLTQALADMRGETDRQLARLTGGPGSPIGMDAKAAELADRVDAYVGIAAYLARQEALITCLDYPTARPVRHRERVRHRHVWLVGERE